MTAPITTRRGSDSQLDRWRSVARALAATWLNSLREAWSNRRGFWIQVGAMMANDAVWIFFWGFFFRRFESVRGWEFADMIILLSVLTFAAGLVIGFLANSRLIGHLIADGQLDATLSLPVPTLPYLLARRIDVAFIGDSLFGVVLFILMGDPTPARLAVFVGVALLSATVMVGFLILVGSTAFFVGRSEVGDLGFHALILFSNYPIDLFGGRTKLLLFALVPAGFVSGVPVRLVNAFDWRWAAILTAVAAAFLTAGSTAFRLGLRRYTSGATWTAA